MSIVSTTRMTARQFLELGEDPPGLRLELVNGEVAVRPSPIPAHGYTVVQLAALLAHHIKKLKLGRLYPDVDTIFGEYDVRRPDLLYFAKDRVHLIGEKAMEGPPDLCVEVLSPSSRQIDRRDKFAQYAQGGVVHYWIVDPQERTFEAFKLSRRKYRSAVAGERDDVVSAPPFAELAIPLADLWQPAR
jgi:Uma2 family endonuclease